MKVLLVHNFYGSEAPSGENVVFEAEKALLENKGHTVQLFTRHSDEVRSQGLRGGVKAAAAVPWNPFAAAALRKRIDSFQPDVVHTHNTFPLISPAIFHAIGRGAARVLTLHNYRLLCPAAIPMRRDTVCTDCIQRRSVLPALQHGCYRDSRLATLPLAMSVALHRMSGTWLHQVDAFIALSNFQKNMMAVGGLPIEKIYVKPNFYAGRPVLQPFSSRTEKVVFVGRLGREKGVHTLIEAWRRWGRANAPVLQVIGDGPLRESLQIQARDLPVEFLGQISAELAQRAIAESKLLVLPSECFEGFPMVIREAFAFGTPVAVSQLGPLPDIVQDGENGVVFEPANPESLFNVVHRLWQEPEQLAKLGLGARRQFDEKYNEEANYNMLMAIYEAAIKRSREHK